MVWFFPYILILFLIALFMNAKTIGKFSTPVSWICLKTFWFSSPYVFEEVSIFFSEDADFPSKTVHDCKLTLFELKARFFEFYVQFSYEQSLSNRVKDFIRFNFKIGTPEGFKSVKYRKMEWHHCPIFSRAIYFV